MRFLYLYLFILWTLGMMFYWHVQHKACHAGLSEDFNEESKEGPSQKSVAPISFFESASLPDTLSSFTLLKDSLIANLDPGQVLRISAPYHEGESNTSGEENLGMARAKSAAKLFEPELAPELLVVEGYLDSSANDLIPIFQIFNRSELMPESEDRYVIYFSPGSYEVLNRSTVMHRIESISARVKASKENIVINAYCDDIESSNPKKLSDLRAWVARKLFEDDHVRRIRVRKRFYGKSDSNPVASNRTEEGRALNRRAEIQIIKAN